MTTNLCPDGDSALELSFWPFMCTSDVGRLVEGTDSACAVCSTTNSCGRLLVDGDVCLPESMEKQRMEREANSRKERNVHKRCAVGVTAV